MPSKEDSQGQRESPQNLKKLEKTECAIIQLACFRRAGRILQRIQNTMERCLQHAIQRACQLVFPTAKSNSKSPHPLHLLV